MAWRRKRAFKKKHPKRKDGIGFKALCAWTILIITLAALNIFLLGPFFEKAGAAVSGYAQLSQILNGLEKIVIRRFGEDGKLRIYIGDLISGRGHSSDGQKFSIKGFKSQDRELEIDLGQ